MGITGFDYIKELISAVMVVQPLNNEQNINGETLKMAA